MERGEGVTTGGKRRGKIREVIKMATDVPTVDRLEKLIWRTKAGKVKVLLLAGGLYLE